MTDAREYSGFQTRRRRRTHPADVTADRLVDQVTKWNEKFEGYERDAFGMVIQCLREIAEGER